MDKLMLKIVTPDRLFFDDEIDMLIAKSSEGDFAIMKNHIPMIAALDIRYLRIKQNGEFRYAAIAGGYLTFKDNQITIISDAVEWREEIDKNRALEAQKRAEARVKKAKNEFEMDRAELDLKRAINRLKMLD